MSLAQVPEHLPGEPDRRPTPPAAFAVRLVLRAASIALLAILTVWSWPLYLVGRLVYGAPPNVPRWGQIRRYLRLIWVVDPPPPGLPVRLRLWLTLSVLRKIVVTPLWGLAWLLDELLYGRALDATPIVAPLIEISAARSGSTQLCRYLEDDPYHVAPSVAEALFPYLWMWRLAPVTIGRFLTPDRVRAVMEEQLPQEFVERHEGDPFRTDTFDGALYVAHLNHLAPFLGPEVFVEDFGFAVAAPHNARQWEEDFVALFDRIGRKTLYHKGPGPDGRPRRLFVKGHFLAAADALAARYPDARFLTILRDPGPRLRSAINYLRANPVDATLGSVPWAWLGAGLAETEARYCEVEQAWYTRPDGPRRCVVRFSDFITDLEGTMARIYAECLDTPQLPPWVPRAHPPRKRTAYLLDRTLAQVGVDEAALLARLSAYRAWCAGDVSRSPGSPPDGASADPPLSPAP